MCQFGARLGGELKGPVEETFLSDENGHENVGDEDVSQGWRVFDHVAFQNRDGQCDKVHGRHIGHESVVWRKREKTE